MEKNMGGKAPYVLHTAARTQNCCCSVNPFFSYCLPRVPPRVPPTPVYMAAQVILWLQEKLKSVWLGEGKSACLRSSRGVARAPGFRVLFPNWCLAGLQYPPQDWVSRSLCLDGP